MVDRATLKIDPSSSSDSGLINEESANYQDKGESFPGFSRTSSSTFDQQQDTPTFALPRKPKKRLVTKCGSLKVVAKNVPRKTQLYLADIFTTMIDLRWSWVILLFCASYVASWVVFGLLWWSLVAIRGPSVCAVEVLNYFL